MQNKQVVSWGVVAALILCAPPAEATARIGVTNLDNYRNAITQAVKGMDPGLFLMLIEPPQRPDPASPDDPLPVFAGYDISSGTVVFAPAAPGKPSQNGWHEHPVPLGLTLVVQGALWVQYKANPTCLVRYPTGSVIIEQRGDVHNAFNLDPNVATILRTAFFVGHGKSNRTDWPDPVTGDPNVASPPPTQLCQ